LGQDDAHHSGLTPGKGTYTGLGRSGYGSLGGQSQCRAAGKNRAAGQGTPRLTPKRDPKATSRQKVNNNSDTHKEKCEQRDPDAQV
jgi:hypothetical protein